MGNKKFGKTFISLHASYLRVVSGSGGVAGGGGQVDPSSAYFTILIPKQRKIKN
ncbi:hypothetical protein J8M20_17305 [Pseudoalteromonas luteoviolacea]|uniref:hypothetical protein n=1 Tax=Pseudoalteromonas luteoviolacea TaxID=43657 RepID=UPI001B38E5D4|nr:hypothetical protein [Pseudoalteromonas luteoviolacea]MBQ4813123.1 hypothetical protein [Pseudoalteromonas luteoviolacea]